MVLSAVGLLAPFASMAAVQQGRAVAWGANGLGQTNVPADLTNVIAVASGHYHGLALRADGTVRGWGYDFSGQATPPATLSGIVAISAGAQHSLALRSNGRVVAWGDNGSGQTNIPAGLQNVMAISAGQYHNLALLSNGVVVAWGSGPATNVPANLRAVAIAAGGNHSLALRTDGTVAGWGQNTYGQANTAGLLQIRGVAAGDDFSAVILNNRTVYAWGNRAQGRTNTAGLTSIVRIAAGVAHGLALRDDGWLFAWGDNSSGQVNVPTNFTRWIGMGGGFSHGVGLVVIPPSIATQPQSQTVVAGTTVNLTVAANGSAPLSFTWRRNGNPIAGATSSTYSIPNAQTNHNGNYTVVITNLSGSITSAVATLTVTAKPVILTEPQNATVGVGWTNIFSVTVSGSSPLRFRWRHAGTNIPNATNATYTNLNVQHRHAGNYVVVITNNFGAVTSAVATLTVVDPPLILTQPQGQIVLQGAPLSFTIVASNAATYQWRFNGQAISGATGPVHIIDSAQTNHAGVYSVALSNPYGATNSQNALLTVISRGAGQNEVVGWGESNIWNGFGYVDLTPPGLTNVQAIAAGAQHSLALFHNGDVLPWGVNTHGQSSTPPGLSNVVAIAAGGFHSLALTAKKTVVAWGLDDYGQSTVPPTLPTNIVAIAAGGYHSLVLKSDGKIVGWGKLPQSAPPPAAGSTAAIGAGVEHSLAVQSNSTVTGWGTNNFGQSFPPAGLNNVIAIAAGENHSVALRNNGTVVAWGANNLGQTNVPPGLSGVVAIACGANHTLALKSDHTVVAWGHGNFRQSDVPSNLPPVLAIAAGGDRSLALVRQALRLSPPLRVGNNIQVMVGTVNGSPITAQRAAGIEILYSPNAAIPSVNWVPFPNPLLWSGATWYFQEQAPSGPRFYMLREDP